MTILLQAGIALAVVGLFAAAWYRYSRPGRLTNDKARVAPQVSTVAPAPGDALVQGSRRPPTI